MKQFLTKIGSVLLASLMLAAFCPIAVAEEAEGDLAASLDAFIAEHESTTAGLAVAVFGERLKLVVTQIVKSGPDAGEICACFALFFDKFDESALVGYSEIEVSVGHEDHAVDTVPDIVFLDDGIRRFNALRSAGAALDIHIFELVEDVIYVVLFVDLHPVYEGVILRRIGDEAEDVVFVQAGKHRSERCPDLKRLAPHTARSVDKKDYVFP